MNRSIKNTLALGALALSGFASATARAQTVTSYNGNAYVIRTDEGNVVKIYGNTGALPASGGSLSGSQGQFTDDDRSATLTGGTAATSGSGGSVDSSSTVNGFSFNDGSGDTISFTSETVLSHADISGVTGSVAFSGLVVDGTSYPSTVAPNTVISLRAGGTITLNQQINSSIAGHNEITVEGVDILSPTHFQLNVGVANSGVTFPQSAATPAPSSALVLLLGAVPIVGVLRKRRKQ